MENIYENKYKNDGYYWGETPSKICYKLLQLKPPNRQLKLLNIGCEEGRNTVFFARNGYKLLTFDASSKGIEKSEKIGQ